ncbi:MAG: hypothetical protein ABI068_15850 [Ktedonobacterales bacterium]
MIAWRDGGANVNRRAPGALIACLLLSLALVACGSQPPPNLPGGTYSSAQYHFKVTYPNGWQTNASTQASATAPLILIITRSSVRSEPGSLVSTFTLDVLSLQDKSVAALAKKLPTNKSLTRTTLAGLTAYTDTPLQQQSTNGQVTITHTDYYLVHGAYEYQLSTDALTGDSSALASIVNSFTII